MSDYVFRLKTIQGTDITVTRKNTSTTFYSIKSHHNDEKVAIDERSLQCLARWAEKALPQTSFYVDMKEVEVPEGYVMVCRPFFGLPPGTLLKREDGFIILPFEPYLLVEDKSYNSCLVYPS